MSFQVDKKGYYGKFGGAFIPEMLYPNVKNLEDNYLKIMESDAFKREFIDLLKNYVGRPSPLYYSKRLSHKYNINLYLKREDLNHTGSHKINNTIGQILMARHLGKKRIIAETGAGQHGVATATVCAREGLECIVFMGATDVARQMPNVEKMQMLGATVVPVQSGNKTLKDATNEAIRDWINHPNETHYIIGSVVGPHPYPDMVARFQSVISEEMRSQLQEQTGSPLPDSIIACVGGGSNAAGAFYHYLDEKSVRLIAVEADGLGLETGETAATIAAGVTGIIHGSKTLLMQTDDGQIIEPYSISAGLDYPGIGPIHANLHDSHRAEFVRATDDEAMDAAFELTQMEGIIPALESAHALAALPKLNFKKGETVVVNLSGRGDKDMEAYRKRLIKNTELSANKPAEKNEAADMWRAEHRIPENKSQSGANEVNGLFVP
ncbi:MAG: tryptophan synthase subunit beta [Salinivirgaceae bacterium]|jgi:tryptophan synthase beta chain|nr:tryptophan synthase subunit beta [Salinivirgaceae bacterium]